MGSDELRRETDEQKVAEVTKDDAVRDGRANNEEVVGERSGRSETTKYTKDTKTGRTTEHAEHTEASNRGDEDENGMKPQKD